MNDRMAQGSGPLAELGSSDIEGQFQAGSVILLSSKLKTQLELSCEKMNPVQREILYKDGADIPAAITRILDSEKSNPLLTAYTLEHPEVMLGRIFHQVHAGLQTRKHDENEYQAEHDQRVTEKCIDFCINALGITPPPDVVLGWLLHDSVEDYGVTHQEIEDFFGKRVAADVRILTIPKEEDLRAMYPEKIRPNDSASQTKMRLKNHFKAESIKGYSVFNIIIKNFDNLDTLESYANNMNRKQIHITMHRDMVKKKAHPPVFWEWDFRENLQYRKKACLLLIQRCRAIHRDPEMNPLAMDCSRMIPIFAEKFMTAEIAFIKAMGESVKLFDIEHPPITPKSSTTTEPHVSSGKKRRHEQRFACGD